MFSYLNLRWKISLIMIIIMTIIVSIVSIVNYTYTTKIIKTEVNSNIQTFNKFYKSNIDNIFGEVEKKIQKLASDDSLLSYVSIVHNRFWEMEKIRKEIAEEAGNKDSRLKNELQEQKTRLYKLIDKLEPYVSGISRKYVNDIDYVNFAFIALSNGLVIADSRSNLQNDSSSFLKKRLDPIDYKNVNFNHLKLINQKPYLLFNLGIKGIAGKVIGYLVLGMSLNDLKNNLDLSLGQYSDTVALINKEGIILNHPDKEQLGIKIENQWILNKIKENIFPVDYMDNNRYYIIDKVKDKDLYLVATILKSEMFKPAAQLGKIDLYIFLVGIIITILIIYVTMLWQLKPLNVLAEKMGKVRKGNLDVHLKIDSKDEIGILARTFNKMINDLKELMIKIKDDQEELRKYELSALQLQINPHFLYNTLDSISLMTRTKEYDEIAEMCIALSQFFRLGLNNGNDIYTIKDELEHIKNYITIQKLRYPDKFDFKINIDEGIYNNECIKIILQPLVENSLQHGLKYHSQGGIINIEGFRERDRVILQVIDNGCGFDEEMISSFTITDNGQLGYALKNVARRIRLYYGDQYGLKIYNTDQGGACVELYLPVKVKVRGSNNV